MGRSPGAALTLRVRRVPFLAVNVGWRLLIFNLDLRLECLSPRLGTGGNAEVEGTGKPTRRQAHDAPGDGPAGRRSLRLAEPELGAGGEPRRTAPRARAETGDDPRGERCLHERREGSGGGSAGVVAERRAELDPGRRGDWIPSSSPDIVRGRSRCTTRPRAEDEAGIPPPAGGTATGCSGPDGQPERVREGPVIVQRRRRVGMLSIRRNESAPSRRQKAHAAPEVGNDAVNLDGDRRRCPGDLKSPGSRDGCLPGTRVGPGPRRAGRKADGKRPP